MSKWARPGQTGQMLIKAGVSGMVILMVAKEVIPSSMATGPRVVMEDKREAVQALTEEQAHPISGT